MIRTGEQLARHNESTKRSRRKLIAANPDRLCPPDHKHGKTNNCHVNHGCRCDDCRTSRNKRRAIPDWEARRLSGMDVTVPMIGTQRRLKALAYVGWSAQAIADMIGSNYRPILKIRNGDNERVKLSTHRKIAEVYQRLALTDAPGRSGEITRGYARHNGYHSALAWNNIDDKNEVPYTVERESDA